MQTIQLVGPYAKGTVITKTLPKTYKFLQIGIEYPFTLPIERYNDLTYNVPEWNINLDPLISIDGTEFVLTGNNMLEYTGLFQSEITIKFLQDVGPLTIIDLKFKDIDE